MLFRLIREALVAPNVGADRTTRIHSHFETRASVCEKWLPLWRLLARQEQPSLVLEG